MLPPGATPSGAPASHQLADETKSQGVHLHFAQGRPPGSLPPSSFDGAVARTCPCDRHEQTADPVPSIQNRTFFGHLPRSTWGRNPRVAGLTCGETRLCWLPCSWLLQFL